MDYMKKQLTPSIFQRLTDTHTDERGIGLSEYIMSEFPAESWNLGSSSEYNILTSLSKKWSE